MTLSCICSFFEKHMVFRLKRFRCVLKFKFLRSIFQVLSFPIWCFHAGIYLEYSYFVRSTSKNPNCLYDKQRSKKIEVSAKALENLCLFFSRCAMPVCTHFFFLPRTSYTVQIPYDNVYHWLYDLTWVQPQYISWKSFIFAPLLPRPRYTLVFF